MRDHRFNWVYLFGAICPTRGVGSALVLPIVNVHAMNKHLAEISTCVTLGAIALLIIDGAGWGELRIRVYAVLDINTYPQPTPVHPIVLCRAWPDARPPPPA